MPSHAAPRAAAVLKPHEPLGAAAACDVRELKRDNGSVFGLSLSGRAFIHHGAKLLAERGLHCVQLVAVAPFLNEAAQCPHLALLHRLDLSGNRIGAAGVRHLAASPYLARLRELGLSGNDLGRAGLRELLDAPWTAHLESLELADNGLDRDDANALAVLPQLAALDLSNNRLAALPELPRRLHSLALARCDLNAIDGDELGGDALRHLNLSLNPVGRAAAEWLSTAGCSRLRTLDLSFTELDATAAAWLSRLSCADTLAKLNLRGNRIDADGARSLAEADFRELAELDFGTNPIGDVGAAALVRSEAFASLERLSLANCGLSDTGVCGLVSSGALGGLRSLSLAWNALGDAAARAMARCPDLAGLQALDLTGTAIGFAGAIALADSSVLTRLRTLTLGENPRLPPDAVAILRQRYNSAAA